jgi:cyanophycinase
MGVNVSTPLVIDRRSANDSENAREVSEADWIYFSGGHLHIGMQILKESRVLDAILTAFQRGVLISGSSAGAMLLCSHSIVITPETNAELEHIIQCCKGRSDWILPPVPVEKCLGLVPRSMCWPHMNQLFSVDWVRSMLPQGFRFIGIDEQTAAVKNAQGRWQIGGRGKVMVGTHHFRDVYPAGTDMDLCMSSF